MAYAAGVDVGSTQTKAVVINEAGEIAGHALIDTGANVTMAAEGAYLEALKTPRCGKKRWSMWWEPDTAATA